MSQFTRLLGIAVLVLSATGCAPNIDDLVTYTNEVRQNTKPTSASDAVSEFTLTFSITEQVAMEKEQAQRGGK